MTSIFRSVLVAVVLVFGMAAQDAALSGHYEGTLETPNGKAQFAIDLDLDAKKAWIGHLTVTPGPREVPLSGIMQSGEDISWGMPFPGNPKFAGKWDKEARTIKGQATVGPSTITLDLKRTADARVVVPAESTAISKELGGKWEGILDTPGGPLRLVLNMQAPEGGRGAATIVSLDQGNASIPVTTITQRNDALELDVKMVGGNYKGKVSADNSSITGEWSQNGNNMPLVWKKAGAAVEPKK